jgi:hypothetical protein
MMGYSVSGSMLVTAAIRMQLIDQPKRHVAPFQPVLLGEVYFGEFDHGLLIVQKVTDISYANPER